MTDSIDNLVSSVEHLERCVSKWHDTNAAYHAKHGYTLSDAFRFSPVVMTKIEEIAAEDQLVKSDYKEWKLYSSELRKLLSSFGKEKTEMQAELDRISNEVRSIHSRANSFATEEAKKILSSRVSFLEIECIRIQDLISDAESKKDANVRLLEKSVDYGAVERIAELRRSMIRLMAEEEEAKDQANDRARLLRRHALIAFAITMLLVLFRAAS